MDSRKDEHFIVVGASLHGLMCALEAQQQSGTGRRQVDIIAQTFPSDAPPLSWSSGLSSCFFGCVKATVSNFEERTLQVLLDMAKPGNGLGHQFEHCEEYSMEQIAEHRLLSVPQFQEISHEELRLRSKHGASFTSVSVVPSILGSHLLNEFVSAGGRIFRGSVRHLNDVLEGETTPFERTNASSSRASDRMKIPVPPSAVIICAGLGARFIGGIEDKGVYPMRIQVARLRMPWVKNGKAFYENEAARNFFVVPLGNGDIIVGGGPVENDWFPIPRPETTSYLLKQAKEHCPYLVPLPSNGESSDVDLRSFLVWEGCDVFAGRKEGPRLEVELFRSHNPRRATPVVFVYGFGPSETRTFHGVAESAIALAQGALEQEQGHCDS